jgi:putative Mn2+ efflux pump MntP
VTPIATIVIAFSMSSDAFAAALAKGAQLHRPTIVEALRTGAIFGVIEAITPVIGWGAGRAASSYIEAIDHWIAFGLLGAIGAKMIWDRVKRPDDEEKPGQHSFLTLAVTAVGTSIDAMDVGVTLALIDADIFVTAAAIGFATFLMTAIGVMVGRVLGSTFGRLAEAVGGVGLIGIGATILIEHTIAA